MKKKSWIKIVLSFAAICRGKMILAVVFAVLGVFGGIVPYFGVYHLLEGAIGDRLSAAFIIFWCGICAGGFLLQVAGYAISTTFAHISAYTILEQIRLKMAERLLHAPLGEILTKPAGKLKDILLDRVENIELPLAHVIPEVGSSLLLSLSLFIYLISIDWRMGLAVMGTLPLCMLPGLGKKSQAAFNEKYTAYMQANTHVNNIIVEYIEGIEVVKTFNQSAASYEKFAGAVKSFRDFTMEWFRASWKSLTLMSTVLPTTLFFTVPVGILLVSQGTITAAQLTICCILALGLVAPLIKFTVYINMGKSIEYALFAADELLLMPELPDGSGTRQPENYSISLEQVSFAYSGEKADQVLHGISLEIPQSQVTALVGPSGGGKSTLAKLISRFWDVAEGAIRIGGVDIREIPLRQLSRMVSFVTQDNFLFNCSLKENIRIGRPEAGDEEVRRALIAAQCEDFINRLEDGWDTPAGEAGKYLSGGEKQRIAIARAILKDAPIVVLDEATAFTDPENEDKIQRSIMALASGKTLLVIAHRLATIQHADQIVVVEDGRIAGCGRQAELLADCPLYQRLWQAHCGTRNWAVSSGREEAAEYV